MRRLATAALVVALSSVAGSVRGADAPEDCSRVGDAATSHTCQHASFGPFQDVQAQPHPGFVFTDISTPHTLFTIGLSADSEQSAVLYLPVATGPFGLYLDEPHALVVLDSSGAEVPARMEHAISSCADPTSLTWVRVHELDETESYTFVIGPTTATSVDLAVEFLPSFTDDLFVDGDADGYGAGEALSSWCGDAPGHASEAGDCDDAAASVSPEGVEVCNGRDDDCTGVADDAAALCAGEPGGAACVTEGGATFCGCASSTDCLDGATCDAATRLCAAPPADGSGGGGGGAGGGGDGGGGSGAGGAGAKEDAANASGCATVHGAGGRESAFVGLFVGLFALTRRRRRAPRGC